MSKEQELKEMLKLYSKQDLWNRIQEKQAMIYDLEAKLVEKDKEIEYQESMKILAVENQNKKAIEQLEKVKEFVEEKSMTQSPFGTQKIYASDVSSIVDNQIKELTHQNEDKGE